MNDLIVFNPLYKNEDVKILTAVVFWLIIPIAISSAIMPEIVLVFTLPGIAIISSLGYAPIMPINEFGCAEFINRGGRIPAPIHSFKN